MDLTYLRGSSLSLNGHFYPTDMPNTRNEIIAIARRHGFEEYLNDKNKIKQTNSEELFNNKIIEPSLTEIHHTDFQDEYNHTFCYLCSINQHEHERTKPRDESKRRKLIPYTNPVARSLSADRITEKPSTLSSDFISYRFIVRTGTQKNSGTRAQVFLYMYGTEKNWTSIHLQKSNSSVSNDGFPSGSIRTFCLKGPNIGQLHHLNVNLVGNRFEKEWFLKEIEIINLNTSVTWLCEFNCWLPKTNEQENNQIKTNVDQLKESSSSSDYLIYILQIHTGDKAFTDTNANVYITIRGSKNQTRRLGLTSSPANLFGQNQLDTFAIIERDLGELLEIVIESDKSQLATDWNIKEMTMWKLIPNNDNEKTPIYFPFNTYFGAKLNRLKSKRELYSVTDYHFKGPICYQISVKTGKVANAGTDANVYLIIYGKSGRTINHQLNNRSKNDFERNSVSQFTIMDIDIGQIDRVNIWHDNSGTGSAWFLDSITICKKYSTCQTISNIYMQRLETITKILYRQFREQMKKPTTLRTYSVNKDQRSLKSNDYDDRSSKNNLGSTRSILRSPTIYDKTSLHKKVTWDEQSIGSQDDLSSLNSQRIGNIKTNVEEKQQKRDDSIEHHIYWISSHNYKDQKWKINSIEEINSFNLDQSTRSLLLSDRGMINNKMKTIVNENDDEIYEFQANRWLAKDKEDGKLEVYLTGKLIQKSSIPSETHIDPKKKLHLDNQHQRYTEEKEESKRSSSAYNLDSVDKSSKSLTSRDSRLTSSSSSPQIQPKDLHPLRRNLAASSRSNTQLKTNEESSKIGSATDKLPVKSPRNNINDLPESSDSQQELLSRLIGQPYNPSRSTISSSKSPRNINEPESLTKISNELPNYSQFIGLSTSSRKINDLNTPIPNERKSLTKISEQPLQHPRSSRSINDLTTSVTKPRDSLTKISREQSSDSLRSTPPLIPSFNQPLKTPRNNENLRNPLTSEQELLARITGEPSYHSQSTLNQRLKSPRQTNDLINSSINEKQSLSKISSESFNRPRLSATSSFSKPMISNNDSTTSLKRSYLDPSVKPQPIPRSNSNLSSQNSVYDQVYKSAYGTAPSDDF